ncbi:GA module-containing protein, partial [Vibrio cholerae O1]|nr:GA module-containing protein [Vibrio cholerae O1]
AQQEVTTKIDAEHKENKKQNDHDVDPDAFKKDKEKAKGEIDKIPDLTPDQKQKYKDRIENSTHKGDPEAIVNQAQKHKKIENA